MNDDMDFLPRWYQSQQAEHVDSAFDHHHTHPLSDSTLEMLGLAIIGAVIVFGVVGTALLVWWWRA